MCSTKYGRGIVFVAIVGLTDTIFLSIDFSKMLFYAIEVSFSFIYPGIYPLTSLFRCGDLNIGRPLQSNCFYRKHVSRRNSWNHSLSKANHWAEYCFCSELLNDIQMNWIW